MTRTTFILAAAFTASLHWPGIAAAECYFVYDEAYRRTFQQAFHVALPHRAGSLSSMEECRATYQAMMSDPQYSGDAGLGRTRCECSDDGGGAGSSPGYQAPQGGSLEQQIASRLVSSLLGALFQVMNAPAGPDGDAIRKKIQKQWDDEEAARKVAEKKRDEEAFRRAHQVASATLGNRPAGGGAAAGAAVEGGVYIGAGRVPALLRSSGAVTEAQWAEARAWQARIDALRAREPLGAAEARELAALEGKRNALWARAVSVPGLTQRDRDALRLKLHVAGGGATASVDDLFELRDQAAKDEARVPVHPLTSMVEASVTYGIKTAIETAGESRADLLADVVVGEGKKVLKFGDAYALGGVAKAVAQGKPEETADPALSWTLSKIVAKAPTLGLGVGTAQGVGAVTTTVARRSIERLVEATDQVVPGLLAPGETGKQWWEARKSELTLPQKWVVEGIGM